MSTVKARTSLDKAIRVYRSHEEMKADEYRYRQSRTVHERMDAYGMKGGKVDVPRLLQGPLVVLQRPDRRDKS